MKTILLLFFTIISITAHAGRLYSPDHGRWLNRDPKGVEGGINEYNSVSNDMVNGFTGGDSIQAGMSFMPGDLVISMGVDAWGYFTFEEAKKILKDKNVIAGFKKLLKLSKYVDNYKYVFNAETLNTGPHNNIPEVFGPVSNLYPIEYNTRRRKWERVNDPNRQPTEYAMDFLGSIKKGFKSKQTVKGVSSSMIRGFKPDAKCYFFVHTHPVARHSRVIDINQGLIIRGSNGKPVSNLKRSLKKADPSPADLNATNSFKKSNFVLNPAFITFIEYIKGQKPKIHKIKERTWKVLGYPSAEAMYKDLGSSQ